MKLCRYFNSQQQIQYAIVLAGGMIPLERLMDAPPDDQTLFARLGEVVQAAADAAADPSQAVPLPAVLLPPVPPPEKILCIGLNYLDHAIETGAQPPSEPIVFSKFNTALIGHGEPIMLPTLSKQVDYEAELVVIIGHTARHVSASDALSYVAGYSCGHDVSARDWQKGRPGGQWLLGKSFDTFAPLGPYFVTADELTDASNLGVRMFLGEEKVQDSTTAQLIFDIPHLIAHLS
jgi:2-keto-4-pentenoate hydratase/2-oxohepta-3-ene-1,7-dioic acid hydratase in catechol pathway